MRALILNRHDAVTDLRWSLKAVQAFMPVKWMSGNCYPHHWSTIYHSIVLDHGKWKYERSWWVKFTCSACRYLVMNVLCWRSTVNDSEMRKLRNTDESPNGPECIARSLAWGNTTARASHEVATVTLVHGRRASLTVFGVLVQSRTPNVCTSKAHF